MNRIAIDGPGGAGKSSVAKLIARDLSIIYVDTGALYRSIGLFILEKGISPTDRAAVIDQLKNIDLKLKFTDRQILLLNGVDVGDRIRTPEISMAASAVSAIPEVRAFLLDTQRKIAKKNSVIMDGRDIGTVILPDADLKIFLVASPEARAIRRYKELCEKGVETTYESVLSEMQERDKNDSTRDVAPCVPADDAIVLDNSSMTLEETAKKIELYLQLAQDTKKSRRLYMFFRGTLGPLVRFFGRVHVTGKENIPKNGGMLMCSNHIGAADMFLIAATFPRQLRFIAKKELFSIPILGRLIRALGAIRVDRKGSNVDAIRRSVDLVRAGEAVAIFPQGHRYPKVNPAETKLQNGAGFIAYHASCPVLPVCIKLKKNTYAPFRRVDIIIGKPIPMEELGYEHGSTAEYREASNRIFGHVLSLGGFAPAALPSPDEHEH